MSKGHDNHDNDELDVNSTVQMSPDELARLHAELEGKQARAAAAPAKPVKAAAPKADNPPRKANPERYLAPAQTGGTGLLIVGGIGAILAGLGPALGVIPMFQGMGDMLAMLFVGAGLSAVGHLMLGLGMFGAISRTGGIAALVGTLHIVAVLGLVFFLLAALGVIQVDGDLAKLVIVAPAALPGTAWLLSGIWALSATRALGVMGILHGIFAMLGGGALVANVVGGLAGAFGGDDDLAIALTLGGIGAVLLGAIFLSIPMFGRLRKAPTA